MAARFGARLSGAALMAGSDSHRCACCRLFIPGSRVMCRADRKLVPAGIEADVDAAGKRGDRREVQRLIAVAVAAVSDIKREAAAA